MPSTMPPCCIWWLRACHEVLPLLRRRLEANEYRSVEDLKEDFGLILYLKEQWSDIEDAAEQTGAIVTLQGLYDLVSKSLPVPARSAGNLATQVDLGDVV